MIHKNTFPIVYRADLFLLTLTSSSVDSISIIDYFNVSQIVHQLLSHPITNPITAAEVKFLNYIFVQIFKANNSIFSSFPFRSTRPRLSVCHPFKWLTPTNSLETM